MSDRFSAAFVIWMLATIIPVGPVIGSVIAVEAGWREGTWPSFLSTFVLGSTLVALLVMCVLEMADRR